MSYENFPFEEVTKVAERLINDEGYIVFQKWTCGFCGERITMATPNIFHKVGRHEDCTVNQYKTTDIEAQGCNYMVIQANSLKGKNVIHDLLMREDKD